MRVGPCALSSKKHFLLLCVGLSGAWSLADGAVTEMLVARRMARCTKVCVAQAVAPSAGGARRTFLASFPVAHGDDSHLHGAPKVGVVFEMLGSGETFAVQGRLGESILRVAQHGGVDLEGACECSVACSTCHVVLEAEHWDGLDEATEEEDDMLDMAFGLTDTSRLGCQVLLCADDEGRVIRVPSATRNFYVDGHVPVPH